MMILLLVLVDISRSLALSRPINKDRNRRRPSHRARARCYRHRIERTSTRSIESSARQSRRKRCTTMQQRASCGRAWTASMVRAPWLPMRAP